MRDTCGFSLFEVLITLSIFAILLGIGFLNFRPLYSPIDDATNRLESFLKLARAKAMATTSAYRIKIEDNQVSAKRAKHCGDPDNAWAKDSKLTLALPDNVTVTTPSNKVLCFTSRGYAQTSVTYTIKDNKGKTRNLQVLIGGAVRPK